MEKNKEIVIYKSKDGNIELTVNLKDDTVWLTQAQMAALFGKSRITVTEHISHIFREKELNKNAVCRNFRHTATDGNKRIAASLFLYFTNKNGILYKKDGTRVLNDNALVAITIMIAESNPEHKDTIAKMLINLIDKRN